MRAIPAPPRDVVRESIRCFINGFPIEWKDFWFDPGKPIYTDGSAKDVAWPAIAVASSAAWQEDTQGRVRLAVAQVPVSYPAPAVSSEFFAYSIAARATLSDCGEMYQRL